MTHGYVPGRGSTRIRRRIDGESRGAKYLFTVDFLANPLKLCAVNSSNTWVLIVFIFVEFLFEYLGTDCFHFCRIPVELLLSARRIQNVDRCKTRNTPCILVIQVRARSWCRFLHSWWTRLRSKPLFIFIFLFFVLVRWWLIFCSVIGANFISIHHSPLETGLEAVCCIMPVINFKPHYLSSPGSNKT
jgi:hypothetical protein